MKIGLFTDTFPPEINGVANSTKILFDILKANGHEVYVVATKPGVTTAEWDENHEILRLAGIELKSLYGYIMTSPFHLMALSEIRKLNLDMIHAQTEFGVGIFARICAKQLSLPLVSTYHTTYEDYTHYVNFMNSENVDSMMKMAVAKLSKLYGDSSLVVIAPSVKTKQMLEKYNVRSDIDIVPTGLPLNQFLKNENSIFERNEIRNQFNIDSETRLIIYVGRIASEKSLDIVLNGYAAAMKSGSQSRMMIVGGGPDLEQLKELARKLNISDKVIFTGNVAANQVARYYHAADAFVSASLSETQGMTFIEALASGLPLFARPDKVLDQLLIPDKTGWYFDDAEDFAEKICAFELLSSQALSEMSKNAELQVQPYSSEIFYQNIISVYEKALKQYNHMFSIEYVEVKDESVQLNLSSLNGETKRVIVSLDDYCNEGLRSGMKLTTSEIERLASKQDVIRAYQGCIRKIMIKDRTRKEIYDWLTKETQCDIEAINSIVDKLEEKGYIDDERYCREYISKMKITFQGKEKIIRDLKKRGIPYELIQKKFEEVPDDEEQNAFLYAQKLSFLIHNESVLMKKQKIRMKLMQRGYSSEVIDQVLPRLDFSDDQSRELVNLRKCAYKARKRYEKKYQSTKLRNALYRYCASQGYSSENIYAILDEMEWLDD